MLLVLRFLASSGGKVSGGKVQRVAIARRWCRSGLLGSKGQPSRAVKKPRVVEPSEPRQWQSVRATAIADSRLAARHGGV